jgi:hypothetical protein
MTQLIRKSGLGRSFGAMALACTLVHLGAGRAAAQPAGEGPLVLRLPVSARSLAMGNAGYATSDADILFTSPAMLSSARGVSASFQRFGSAATTGSLAQVTTVGSLAIGIGGQFLDWQAPGPTYVESVQHGATHLSDGGVVDASSSAFTLGVARTIKGYRLGASVKYAEDRLSITHDGTVAVDLGMQRPVWVGTLALSVQNLGPGLRLGGVDGTLPRRVAVGFGAMRALSAHWDLGAQAALSLEGDWFVRPAGGAELGFVPIDGVSFALRGGLRLPREPDEALATGGVGITVDRLSLDYAIDPMRGGRPVSHRLGFRIK